MSGDKIADERKIVVRTGQDEERREKVIEQEEKKCI